MQADLNTRIGIIGGGQLGKMLIEAAQPLNIYCNILENDAHAPASRIADEQIVGTLTDADKIRQLAAISDVLTYEIEHVGVDTLHQLEAEGKLIIPSPKILEIIKDKGLQKQFYANNNIPTAPFVLVNSPADWKEALTTSGFTKFAAKSRTDGYDGKGVALCNAADILSGAASIPFDSPCMLEQFVECEKELSVIVARDREGKTTTFPLVEMEFDPIANLVEYLACPAQVSNAVEDEARRIATLTIEKMQGIGIFAVEMFLDKAGNILVNEVAPRPHNSGHHTIEACYTSQYEQLLRILVGLPLGDTTLIQPAVMLNLLGAEGFSGKYRLSGIEEVMAMPGIYIHLYNKKESRPMRKMGHVSIIAPTLEEAKQKATFVKNTLTFIPA
ncbi:MAG: 5-(carboxyamino)imidazole ribonucleotide synthase [Bacteroidetes bacterium]|nr:MAG: 5-(carboxyamino)imidazole ribonucleotide synthase [Bacteroidota bacterium]